MENNQKVGLEDKFTEEEQKKIDEIATKKFTEEDIFNLDKNLDEDSVSSKTPGQNYAVVAFVGPDLFTAKAEQFGFKVLGIFNTIKDAKEHIELLSENNAEKFYDKCIVELYKFVPTYPFMGISQDNIDEYMNNIIVSYKKKFITDKIAYEIRKHKLKSNAGKTVEMEKPEDLPDFDELNKMMNEQYENENNTNNTNNDKSEKERIIKELEEDLRKSELKKKMNNVQQKNKNARKSQVKIKNKDDENELAEKKNAILKSKTVMKLKKTLEKVDGQEYVAITFIQDPTNTNPSSRCVMKIKGAFATYEECREFCKKSSEIKGNDIYDILVAEMYSWLPCNPNVEEIEREYNNEILNNFNKTHKTESDIAQSFSKYNTKKVFHGTENDGMLPPEPEKEKDKEENVQSIYNSLLGENISTKSFRNTSNR